MALSIRSFSPFKVIVVVACMFATSMFYFPFEFKVLPGVNTKMMLAAIALAILLLRMVYKRDLTMTKDFLYLSMLAGVVSFCGFVAVTYNNTDDYAYATYLTSAWTWWGAAYTVSRLIGWIHGRLTWRLVVNYLTAVCVFQCVAAVLIDMQPAVKAFVDSYIEQGQDFLNSYRIQRLYGIGASLDIAGLRFAAVLVMIIYLLANADIQKRWYEYFAYFLSFTIITVAGNMIARTTLVGTIIALAYLGYITFKQTKRMEHNYFVLWRWLGGILVVSIPLLIFSYQTDAKMRHNLEFAFEGFFNLAEHGTFSYASNEKLRTMYVWPDNLKTWVVGDGYFTNPRYTDSHYTGERYLGFYMGTDVGYLRLIFYFGVIGLLAFSFFMLKVGQVCIKKFPQWRALFLMLLLTHFVVWLKVSSDLFMAFALFLCLDAERQEENELEELYEEDSSASSTLLTPNS